MYKVVMLRERGEGLVRVSCIVESSMARVEYREGEWSRPCEESLKAGYGLLVFSSRKMAEEWGDDSFGEYEGDWELWKCRVRGVFEEMPVMGKWTVSRPWSGSPKTGVSKPLVWPWGTKMVREVMLTWGVDNVGWGEKLSV